MNGPYDYVAPSYWTLDKDLLGGAWSFNTETSMGPAVPPVESLRAMFPKEKLWPVNDAWDYHSGGGPFKSIGLYKTAVDQRYGPSDNVEDFARKSQAISYEGERAMFEAFSRNKYEATGVIQWMLNNAWPSVIWHLRAGARANLKVAVPGRRARRRRRGLLAPVPPDRCSERERRRDGLAAT